MGVGAKRTALCDCGSGKKYKHCCQYRKPVNQSIVFRFKEPKEITGVQISADGQVTPLENGQVAVPDAAWLAASYARPRARSL
jgi:hypothetical protein